MIGDNEFLILKRVCADNLRAILDYQNLDEQHLRAILLACLNDSCTVFREMVKPRGHVKKMRTVMNRRSGQKIQVVVTITWATDEDGTLKRAPDGEKFLAFFEDVKTISDYTMAVRAEKRRKS